MPKEKNVALRVLVPLVLVGAGLVIGARFFLASPNKPIPQTPSKQPDPSNVPTPAAATNATSAPSPAGGPTETKKPALPDASPTSTPLAVRESPNLAPINGTAFHAEIFANTPESYGSLGSVDPADPAGNALRVEFSKLGAGIQSLTLAKHFTTISKEEHVELQGAVEGDVALSNGLVTKSAIVPFSALGISINGVSVSLAGTTSEPVWRPVESARVGTFEAYVLDDAGKRIVRVERIYTVEPGRYDATLMQRIENLTSSALKVTWYQIGPTDILHDSIGYGSDQRYLRFGYLLSASKDPSQSIVQGSQYRIPHRDVVGKATTPGSYLFELAMWPNETSKQELHTLVWTGLTNRYFGIAAFSLFDPSATSGVKSFAWIGGISRLVYANGPVPQGGKTSEFVAIRLESVPMDLAPAASTSFGHGIYAGPLNKREIEKDPVATAAGLDNLIVYNMGGMCSPCTFTFMTAIIRGLLITLHNYVVFDWAIAIMLMVLVVRTILHPITRWSQIKMGRFGKQMQAIAPKSKAIQEKYKGDPKKIQEETAKLWREEGISPAGMLGCLPGFLQMPVWFALYAVIFYSVELRQQGAFFGIFQKLQPPTSPFWQFLGDLSQPDHLLTFSQPVSIPLLSNLMGPVNGFNILPLMLGVVFFIQQKYLTPPTTMELSPEQQAQQKMMKWMSVLMFPLFMYNAPAGLSLYFFTNTSLAILESRWIRAHLDQLDTKNPPGKGPRKKGFLQRVMEAAEERQRMMQQPMQGGKPPRKRV